MNATVRMVWWMNRLRCMSVAEMGYRVRQAARTRMARSAAGRAAPEPLPRARTFRIQGAPELAPGQVEALLAEADRICAGHVVLFADRSFDVGVPTVWNRDPYTGVTGPSIFAGDISHDKSEVVGDIKHVWELNRHLHLVRLAQAWSVSGDVRWLHAIEQQLRSWLDQCPPLIGPNWMSPMELGIRLINWALLWQLVGGEASSLFAGESGQRLRADWLASIHAHCRTISRNLSRHSSANNHLIGELAGLFVAASVWPCWKASNGWMEKARLELEQQARLQYSLDGVNREQAFGYHVFSAEFLFVAGLVGQACDVAFSRTYWSVLQRALRFLRSVRDVGGNVPNVGDSDDGSVFRLDAAGSDRAAQLLALGEAVFGVPERAPGSAIASTPASSHAGVRWLLHALPGRRPDADTHEPDTGWAFPDGGYLLFGSQFGEENEIKGMLDCGPLGYLGIAAHGHADALCADAVGGRRRSAGRFRHLFLLARPEMARLLPRHLGPQYGAHRRPRPVGLGRAFHVAAQGARQHRAHAGLAPRIRFPRLARRLYPPGRPGAAPAQRALRRRHLDPDRARRVAAKKPMRSSSSGISRRN
jgi:hypothetical protein